MIYPGVFAVALELAWSLNRFEWDSGLMRESVKTGISFGLTSGVITTLGLMVGLHSGTH